MEKAAPLTKHRLKNEERKTTIRDWQLEWSNTLKAA